RRALRHHNHLPFRHHVQTVRRSPVHRSCVVLVLLALRSPAYAQETRDGDIVFSSYRGHTAIRRFSLASVLPSRSWVTPLAAPRTEESRPATSEAVVTDDIDRLVEKRQHEPPASALGAGMGLIEQCLEREITAKCQGVRRV